MVQASLSYNNNNNYNKAFSPKQVGEKRSCRFRVYVISLPDESYQIATAFMQVLRQGKGDRRSIGASEKGVGCSD
uniref:Uncharacterized protein n=1 Tax=Aegilops tauschii TaxID=37682 RepID=M8BQ98_AEGTA